MKESFRAYKQTEEQAQQAFQTSQEFIQLFDQENPDFSQFTNVPGLDAWVEQNKEQLIQLSKNVNVVNQIITKFIDPAKISLLQTLDQVDVSKLTQKIVMREKKQSEIFDEINEKFGDRFTDFENKVSKTGQSLDKLRGLAVGLNANGFPGGSGGGGGIDKVVGALNFFVVRKKLLKKYIFFNLFLKIFNFQGNLIILGIL